MWKRTRQSKSMSEIKTKKKYIINFILYIFIFASQPLWSTSEVNSPHFNVAIKEQNTILDQLSRKKFENEFVTEEAIRNFKTIPLKEQFEIKKLFHYLFKEELFSFSIYGDKPISFSESLDEYSADELLKFNSLRDYCKDIFENMIEPTSLLRKRWETWEKYKDRFHLKKYLLLKKKIDKNEVIFFINKDVFKKTINQHIHLFKRAIREKITAKQLLTEFADENTKIFDILHKNEGLLGILLGFGPHNAMLFQQREDLENQLNIINKSGIYKSISIEKKLDVINSKLQILREHDFNIISSINQVRFVADHTHPETSKLRNKYDQLKIKINEILSNDDWFEQLLIQLTSD